MTDSFHYLMCVCVTISRFLCCLGESSNIFHDGFGPKKVTILVGAHGEQKRVTCMMIIPLVMVNSWWFFMAKVGDFFFGFTP